MSGDSEQTTETESAAAEPISNARILVLMFVVSVFGAIAGSIYLSASFGIGFFIGGILSLANYYWLKQSLKNVFDSAAAGAANRLTPAKYFVRYAVLAAILTLVYLTKIVPLIAVLLGLASFSVAIIFEAVIRIFAVFFNKKEI